VSFLTEPSLIVAIIEVLIGLGIIAIAADHFVEGAANVAHISKISPIIIGAVVVGFGTSAPELLVSGLAALDGENDLGVGNIIGSNVANLSLVLGVAALIGTLNVSQRILKKEAALSLTATLLFAVFAVGRLNKLEGIILLTVLAGFLFWIVSSGRNEKVDLEEVEIDSNATLGSQAVRTLIGLVGTMSAAQVLVWGAIGIADYAGLSGGFVGLSLVAAGTSLPELVTAVVAARKGKTDLILGNLLGSNMFNSLAVGGSIALLGTGVLADPSTAYSGIVIMLAVSIMTFIIMVWRGKFERVAGGLLLGVWLLAMLYLGVNA